MKRGISPLIATVLIIGFVIVLALVVVTWGGGFIKSTTKETGETALKQIDCLQDINIDISSACDNYGSVVVNVVNNGETDILKFLVKTNIGAGETLSGVSGFGGALLGAVVVDSEPVNPEKISYVELIPVVEEGVCKGLSFKEKEITGGCEKIPDDYENVRYFNLIPNSGFESGLDGWEIKDSGETGLEPVIVDDDAKGKVLKTSSVLGEIGSTVGSVGFVKLVPGKEYNVGFFAKGENIVAGASYYQTLRCVTKLYDSGQSQVYEFGKEADSGTYDWKQFSSAFTRADANYLKIHKTGILTKGKGTGYIDGVRAYCVDC